MPGSAVVDNTLSGEQSDRLAESPNSPLREVEPLQQNLESEHLEQSSAASENLRPDISKTVSAEAQIEVESIEVESIGTSHEHNKEILVAARAGDEDEVRRLLAQGTDIETKDSDGRTALHNASEFGHESVVRFLVEKGANISARTHDHWQALHMAAEFGNTDVIRLLLDHGVEVDAKGDIDITALELALWSNHEPVVKLLLEKGADVGVKDEYGVEPLHAAAKEGHARIAQLLLDKSAKIDAQNIEGWTPLQYAVRYGTPETVQVLLAHGASVNLPDEDGWTPMHKVHSNTKSHRKLKMRLLLDHGADVHATTDEGWTPLHTACRYGRMEVAQTLLDHGASRNITDKNGWTALHLASSESHGAVVQLLLAKGADAGVETDTCQSALLLCIASQSNAGGEVEPKASRKLALESLSKKTDLSKKKSALSTITTQEDLEILTDVRHANQSDEPGLKELKIKWFAERHDKHHLVCELLMCQDISIPQKPRTALQWAAYHGKPDIVWSLLKTTKPDKRASIDRHEATQIANLRKANRADPLTSRREMKIEQRKERGGRRDGDLGRSRNVPQNERPLARLGPNQVPKPDQEKGVKFSLTLDMLRDPPLVVGMSDSDEKYDMPTIEQPLLDEIADYDATIVDFYRAEGRVNFLRRSRPIYDVIYNKKAGTKSIMDEARKKLEEISPEAAQEKHYAGDERQLRWIHLPANNMTWMQDLAKRIFHDKGRSKEEYLRLIEFMRKSWQELPAGNSPAKFMKPRCWKEGIARKKSENPSAVNVATQTSTEQYQVDQVSIRKTSRNESNADPPQSSSAVEGEEEIATADGREKDTSGESRKDVVQKEARPQFEAEEQGLIEIQEKGPSETRERELGQEEKEILIKTPAESEAGNALAPTSSMTPEMPLRASKADCASQRVKGASPNDASRKASVYQRVALYMPYITFGECYAEHDNIPWRTRYEDLIKAYSEKGSIIHRSRSLDEFFYHSLSNMSERNADQVATRYLNEGKRGRELENLNGWQILRVDQLWLWVIDEETIITCSTHRPDESDDPILEKPFSYLWEQKGRGKGQPAPSSVDEMSKFIVQFSIDFINRATWYVETSEKSAMQIFADTVNEKAVQEADLFTDFTKKTGRKLKESRDAEQAQGRKPENNSELEDWDSIKKAAELLKEVKDIRDELNILKTLLTQQKTVWYKLIGHAPGTEDSKGPADILEEIKEMDKTSEGIHAAVNGVLSLEQNGINITEAVLSREQTKESIRQGRTLMVFTIVTITFLPLSFLASLFALDVSIFQHDRQGKLSYQPGWIFPIILCISAGISTPLILFAFYVEEMTRLLKRMLGRASPASKGGLTTNPNGIGQIQGWLRSKRNQLGDNKRDTSVTRPENNPNGPEKNGNDKLVQKLSGEGARSANNLDETKKSLLTRLRRVRSGDDADNIEGEKNV